MSENPCSGTEFVQIGPNITDDGTRLEAITHLRVFLGDVLGQPFGQLVVDTFRTRTLQYLTTDHCLVDNGHASIGSLEHPNGLLCGFAMHFDPNRMKLTDFQKMSLPDDPFTLRHNLEPQLT